MRPLPNVDAIASWREQLGISRSELARRAGISRTTVARIETGEVDAHYSTMQKLVDTLIHLSSQKDTPIAGDLMTEKLRVFPDSTPLREIVEVMHETSISQFPLVNDRAQLVGLVSEGSILRYLGARGLTLENVPDLRATDASDQVEGIPPSLPLDEIRSLLERNRTLVVVDGDHPVGIISVLDVL